MAETVRNLLSPDLAVSLGFAHFKGQPILPFAKFGRNTAVGSGTFEPITPTGVLNFLQAPDTMRIKAGGNGADNAAAAGAREITLQGIAVVNGNLRIATEKLVTAGASASNPTALSWWRVFRAFVSAAGAYGGTNIGIITIQNVNTPLERLTIPAGVGQSQTSAFATPDDKTLFVDQFILSVDVNQNAEIQIVTRENFNVLVPFSAARVRATTEISTNAIDVPLMTPLEVPPLTDIWVVGKATAASAVVSTIMNGKLAANS